MKRKELVSVLLVCMIVLNPFVGVRGSGRTLLAPGAVLHRNLLEDAAKVSSGAGDEMW